MGKLLKNMAAVATFIEKVSEYTGRAVSWLTLMLVLLVFTVVILRYLFNIGSIPLQELIIYLHGMIFLLGSAYTLQQNQHVRADVFYSVMSHQKRAWVDLIGSIVLLLPVCIFIFSMSLEYVLLSWRIGESSGEAGGLSRLYLLKTLLLVMPFLLMLQGIAWILRCSLFLFADAQSPYSFKSSNDVKVAN